MMRHLKILMAAGLVGATACGSGSDGVSASASELREPSSVLEAEREGAELARSEPHRADSPFEADRLKHDFGRVPIDGGKVETLFRVANEGPKEVRLISVATSCGCTTAFADFADGTQIGPFGMPGHGLRTDAGRTVQVGESFDVRVVFDPAAHGPDAIGRVMREIILATGDGGQVRLQITADVVRG